MKWLTRSVLIKYLRWCENLYDEFGDLKYKASPMLKKLVRANQWGRRTGRGFYEYNKDGVKITKSTPIVEQIKISIETIIYYIIKFFYNENISS